MLHEAEFVLSVVFGFLLIKTDGRKSLLMYLSLFFRARMGRKTHFDAFSDEI